MAIQKISKARISDQVYQQMQDQIVNGDWKPGNRIPSENELAEQFGVSRVTVRNALQKLAALGLIETRLGDGSYVCQPEAKAMLQPLVPAAFLTDNSLGEILQFRRMIEGPVCGEACRQAGPEAVEALSGLYREMVDSSADLRQFADCDYRFHLEMARLTGNSILIEMYHIVQEVMKSSFDRVVLARGSKAGLYYHGRILEAFSAGDAQRAQAEMQAHMNDLYESYLREFK
ncbi:MAG: FadR/GntR family transcriptional regulator [Candidatus Onthomonas sp.]